MSWKMNVWSRLNARSISVLLLLATQGATQSISSPDLDLSRLGRVALTGDFDAVQVYSFAGQRQEATNNGSNSLLNHLPGGAYEALAYCDGEIQAICPFVLSDGTFAGMIIGGNFTSIGGVATRSVALFNPATRQITGHPGIEGQVTALLCDQETQTAYVGGSFEAAGSSNAIAWNAQGAWANLPFQGFDAPVTSITKAPNGHIIFAGSFTGLGNLTSSTNSSERADQQINIGSASITAQGTSIRENFNRPASILCPNGTDNSNTWLLQNGTPGSWNAEFGFGFQPTKLRLWNTNFEGRGTRTWRFTALPDGGIMNMSYVDPESGDRSYCDATCPLAQSTDTGYQEFTFVDPNVGMNSFTISISDWYGNGAGLDGIQIFQTDIFSYGINDFNSPTCGETATVVSSATTTGPWYETPSFGSTLRYLSVVTGPTTVDDTQIVFSPNVPESGNYTVIVYTPGCNVDSSCSARAIVNVTGTLTSGGEPAFSTQVFQTNLNDKYDQVYQGLIDATTDSFRPEVTIRASGLQTDQLMVASKIKFGYISSSGGLNGLFDYDPNQAVVDMDFSNSAINSAGTTLQPDASILTLATHEDTIYAAGRFADDAFENILAFADNNASSLPGGGLNDVVNHMYSGEEFLYVGGAFNATNTGDFPGLNHVAAYRYSSDEWVALGAGVNGPIDYVVPVPMNLSAEETEMMIAFTGNFDQIEAFDSNAAVEVQNIAIWSPSSNTWLQHIPGMTMQLLSGKVTAASFLPNQTWLGAGNLTTLGQGISGVVGMSEDGGEVTLNKLPVTIEPSTTQLGLRKRALTGDRNVTGVVTGTYDETTGRNLTIFGGRFTSTSSDGSTIHNLLISNGSNNDSVTGLPSGIENNSTFLALTVQSGILFAGGSVTGNVQDSEVNGIVLYDLASASFREVQPAALEGDNVIVNAIAAQPNSPGVYVGGAFESTSQGLSCSCICMYDTTTSQWNSAGSGLAGEIRTLYWSNDNTLIATGNLTLAGNATSVVTYDARDQTWSIMPISGVPEGVTVFAQATNSADQMWVGGTATNGSAFIVKIDDDNVSPVPGLLGSDSIIRSLQVMSLDRQHGSNDYLKRNEALLVTGQLNIVDFGMASAALFNGTTLNPLVLSSKADGTAGSISQLISSNPNDRGSSSQGRSTGIVVLVALCAALGTIFLIVLIGILLNRIQRRRAGYSTVPNVAYADKNPNINRVRPEELFGSLGPRQGAPHV